jgi:sorting nexin-7/30/sorting nexin-8
MKLDKQKMYRLLLKSNILYLCSFDKKDTGFFSLSKSYVNYKIVTVPFEWTVTRRYSDFEWLRDILTKQYPGIFVPPIANKTPTR